LSIFLALKKLAVIKKLDIAFLSVTLDHKLFENLLKDFINRKCKKMPVMTAQEVMDLIPNRYPICYIDRVEELEADKSIKAVKNVTIDEPFFQGHFPGNPVMPGVLVIETLAQAASILILKSSAFYKKTAYLGAIHQAKFRRMVRPGDVLEIEVKMLKVRAKTGSVAAVAKVNGDLVCQTELVFIVGDRDGKDMQAKN
jgi:3-hydroxyacyl-[acyl-carrier-protein] dehydratase